MKPFQKLLSTAFVCVLSILNAQGPSTKNYTLKECIEFALKNNENIITANYNIDYQRQFKKAATDVPKTNVIYTQGQFNSIYKYDNNITISQTIPNPWVFTSHNALAKSHIKCSEYKLEATKAELIYQIKTCYYSLLYYNAVHKILVREDSIYERFLNAVTQKYNLGQATLLEKTTAETQLLDTKNQITESEEDINNYQIELQTLMHTHSDVNAEVSDFEESYLTVATDTGTVKQHPLLKYFEQQINVNEKVKLLESAKIMPDFMVAYFNQSIYGPANIFGTDYFLTKANRLQGFQLGIAIPLWFYPQKSKIEAAKINTKLAESDFNYNTTMLEGQFKQAVTIYLKYRHSISYYKNNVLNNLEVMIAEALKSYGTKDFNYNDYLEVVSRALNIQRNYMNVIHQNNMNALKIEYLLSK